MALLLVIKCERQAWMVVNTFVIEQRGNACVCAYLWEGKEN